MPYEALPDGSLQYIVSRWTKDDLPTWHELYYDFYIPEKYEYLPGHYQLIDPYWKIPRQAYLLATACNQMNKMLVEDGRHDEVLWYLNSHFHCNADQLFFRLNPSLSEGAPDPIYSLPHPGGEPNIFAVKDRECRVDLKQLLSDPITLKLCILEGGMISFPSHPVMQAIITYILQSVIMYFQGSVGWK